MMLTVGTAPRALSQSFPKVSHRRWFVPFRKLKVSEAGSVGLCEWREERGQRERGERGTRLSGGLGRCDAFAAAPTALSHYPQRTRRDSARRRTPKQKQRAPRKRYPSISADIRGYPRTVRTHVRRVVVRVTQIPDVEHNVRVVRHQMVAGPRAVGRLADVADEADCEGVEVGGGGCAREVEPGDEVMCLGFVWVLSCRE